MHGSTSGSLLLVNAEVDSMGGVIDGGVEISSTSSLQQSSDLEKTQAELRQTFTAAEKFRRELEFLQKGGDPLDLKAGTAVSVSVQSTSLIDQPEQFVSSEVKGSFAVTASPHGDSAESSGRLGAPSVGEPNSADNLMLFDGDNKFRQVERRYNNTPNHDGHNAKESGDSVALELPKKSYKRRIRSRPNRDGVRSSSTDAGPPRSGQSLFPSRHASRETKGLVHDADNQEKKYLSNSNSKPKSPNASMALKHVKLNGMQTLKSTLGPANGPFSSVSDDNASQHPQENLVLTSDIQETPLSMSSIEAGSLGLVEQETLSGAGGPPSADTQTAGSGQTQMGQSLDGNNKNELPTNIRNVNSNGALELNLAAKEARNMEGNDLNTVKDDKILNFCNDNSSPCHPSHNENGSTLKVEECLRGSESALQNELDGCTTSQANRKMGSTDDAEQNGLSQNNLKLATKEHEDLILKEAQVIEEKRKRIAGLSVGIFQLESRHKSHWDFVLEEMSWLANDFAQERLWKVTAAAQISRRVAFTSRVRFQQQNSMWKQKEVAHTLAAAVMEFWHTMQVKCEEMELEGRKKDSTLGLRGYAMRFLEYNSSRAQYSSAHAPATPDKMCDIGTLDVSWEDNLTEENLFYTVPPGAIEAYRKSIESHLQQRERTGSSMQEEVETSGYDAVADNTLEEDEGETSTYYLPGAFEGSKPSKATQKKRKHFKSYDLSFMQSLERNIVTQPSMASGKRPASSINVSIPTKRVRTASRQRFTGPSGCIQAPNRADASSGDTNSFQDEQSSLHGGYQMANNMEAESVGDYEKQLHFDLTEVSNRPKKKKKTKHPGSTFEHQWQLDSNFQNDQKDHSKRRLDAHQFGSNGNSVASQMSNMKLLVRDRGRKAKSLKTPAGQPGSGSPWSLFEDQALVVLVHDMGPNWELISDAINSTLQFKRIYRKSKECKERHNLLLDRNTGDGADNAEDSGSSQPYPSTLPGIPEGSARQLFQRLQGPMEEDTLKSHFEKIIMIGRKQHYRKAQNDNQDPKQLQQPHGSHALALSQVCPNNLNGGPVLTPLDLCDAISSGPDFLPVGYQGPHSGGLPVPNQGNFAPMAPSPSSTSSLPSSSNVVLGSHLSSASAPPNSSVREGRYGIPRTGSLSTDDQQRMQQYNQMLSARNMQQSNLPPVSHSGTDRGVRMLPGGNGMGVMSGMNRNMPMARPGFQGISSPSMLTSGSMLSSGAGPGQGNSVRPREPMHVRPNQNTDHHRQIMAPELHMQQVTQPPVQSYQQSPHVLNNNSHPRHLHRPPNHATSSYGIRFIKDRQLQQQRLLQQQLATSNPMSPRVSSPQNTTQIQSSPLVRSPETGCNQRRQHPQQQAKVSKGGKGIIQQNVPANRSLPNGFSSQSVAGKGELQQKRYSVQPQAASSSTPPKLVNQKNVFDSSGAMLDNAAQVGAPRSSSPGTGSDHSGPAVNHGVVNRQSSSDRLPREGGVQWQQQPSS